MSKKPLQEVLCTIHNFRFAYQDEAHAVPYSCPKCASEQAMRVSLELAVVKGHRDILLRAIEIKSTVVVL